MVAAAKQLPGAETPRRLIVAGWAKEFGALLEPGGLYDQPYQELATNASILTIYNAVINWRSHGGVGLSKGDMSIIAWLVKHDLMRRRV